LKGHSVETPNIHPPIIGGSISFMLYEEVGKAKKEIKIAIALDPMSPMPHYVLGQVF